MMSKVLLKWKSPFFNGSNKKSLSSRNEFNKMIYQDKLAKLLYGRDNIIAKENLEKYLNSKFDNQLPFLGAISVYGKTYQNEYSSLLHSLLYNYPKTLELLKLQETPYDKLLIKLNYSISRSYKYYKDYLIGLIQFYIDNPGFSYLLDCYPQTMVSKPFYEYVKQDFNLLHYNKETRTLLYLQLIEKIISARFLELKENKLENIKNALKYFTKSNNNNIASIAKKTRSKLYDYKGVKCPSHLIYISLLSDLEAKKIADFTLSRYFETDTSLNALKLAFQGRLTIIPQNNKDLAGLYNSNPFFSNPLILKYTKIGYLSYIYYHLLDKDYITVDNIWHSIANFKYYKVKKKDGTVEFVSSNKFSQSLSYKKQRLNPKKTKDKELMQLIDFLNKNFKNRKEK